MRMSWQPRTLRSVKTFIQNFAPSVCPIQRPRTSRVPFGKTASWCVSSPPSARSTIAFLKRRTAASSSSTDKGPLPHKLIENLRGTRGQRRIRRQALSFPGRHRLSSCYASHTEFLTLSFLNSVISVLIRVHPWPPFVRVDPCSSVAPFVRVDPCSSVARFIRVNPCSSVAPFVRVDPCSSVARFVRVDPCSSVARFIRVDPCSSVAPFVRVDPCSSCCIRDPLVRVDRWVMSPATCQSALRRPLRRASIRSGALQRDRRESRVAAAPRLPVETRSSGRRPAARNSPG
jgi:hypothetical protein